MSNISFKKNSWGTLKITDIVNPIFIEHEYFGFTDTNYPFDSYQFKGMIDNKQITLVNIDKNSIYYEFLNHLLELDENHEEQLQAKEDAKKKAEEDAKVKELELAKQKEKEEQIKAKELKKVEDKRNNKKIKIVTGEDISKSITDNL